LPKKEKMKKKSSRENTSNSFGEFLEDPPVALAFVVFALLSLMFSLMQFEAAIR